MERFYVETHTYPHETEPTMFRLKCKVINLENGDQVATGTGGAQYGVPATFGMTGNDFHMEVVSSMELGTDGYCDVTIRRGGLVVTRHRASIDFPAPETK